MTVFLSHISEEASEARALGKQLESALPGLKVFVSATDIHLGHSWLMEVHKALERSQVTLALCSPNSVRKKNQREPSSSYLCDSKRSPYPGASHNGSGSIISTRLRINACFPPSRSERLSCLVYRATN